MREIAAFDGLLIVHAEDAHEITGVPPPAGDYQGFLRSRPPAAEQRDRHGARPGRADRRPGARAAPVQCGGAARLTAARRRGIRVTAETCPHYLSFAAADIPDGATQFKCCPPIRTPPTATRCGRGSGPAMIDCVVSDHSPCTADLKHPDTGDFAAAWGGIASLQLGLPVVWTAARSRGVPLTDVVTWMAARPAALAGLTRKGALARGRDADLCVFAPDDSFVVDAAALAHRNPCPPTTGSG